MFPRFIGFTAKHFKPEPLWRIPDSWTEEMVQQLLRLSKGRYLRVIDPGTFPPAERAALLNSYYGLQQIFRPDKDSKEDAEILKSFFLVAELSLEWQRICALAKTIEEEAVGTNPDMVEDEKTEVQKRRIAAARKRDRDQEVSRAYLASLNPEGKALVKRIITFFKSKRGRCTQGALFAGCPDIADSGFSKHILARMKEAEILRNDDDGKGYQLADWPGWPTP